MKVLSPAQDLLTETEIQRPVIELEFAPDVGIHQFGAGKLGQRIEARVVEVLEAGVAVFQQVVVPEFAADLQPEVVPAKRQFGGTFDHP